MSGDAISRTADVVVVGAGVAGLAVAHAVAGRGGRVVVLDAADRVGGQVRTTVEDGYTVEHGATALMTPRGEVAGLFDRLGLTARLQRAAESSRRTAIWTGGKLRWVPTGLFQMIGSDLLSARGKLRAVAEPLLGRSPGDEDCSVHDFARRRFGVEVADVVAMAAVQGVTAGDARATSLAGFSARMAGLDQAAGRSGVVGQLVRNRTGGQRRRPVTLRHGGLAVLPAALAGALGDRVELGHEVRTISRGEERRWAVRSARGTIETDTVVLAVPAHRAAVLLRDLVPAAADKLASVRFCDLRVVSFGFHRDAFPLVPRGFGFLAPPGELGIIGATVSSNAFPEQAPPNRVLVRAFTGGVAHPGAADQPVDEVLGELRRTLGVRGEPERVWDFPWPQGIPQPVIGHGDLVDAVHQDLGRFPGLHLAGNSYRGVGLDDTLTHALALGDELAAGVREVRDDRPDRHAHR